MGRPDLANHPRFVTHRARGENQDEIEGIVAQWTAQHDALDLERILNEAGVICGPIYTIADIFDDPQYKAREMLIEHHVQEIGTFVGPGIVPKFSKTPGSVRWSGTWQEGRHNSEIYGGLLGLSNETIDDLRANGIL